MPTPPAPARRRLLSPDARTVWALVGLLALDLVLFGDVLTSPAPNIPCQRASDAGRYFAPLRDFAYAEMSRGQLPLWNPYIFAGTPCLAASQPALLYPLNLHYLFLPVAKAVSVEIALHVYLLGVFVFLWARFWKLTHAAASFSAVAAMLSGPYFLHVMAGHLSLLASWPWAALAFLSADAFLESRRPAHAFTGATALTLALLAGHPQGVFQTAVVLALYVALRLSMQRNRLSTVPGLALLFLAPAGLGAVQLWPTIQLGAETLRAGGLSYDKASSYSFPPEAALTFLAPLVFGDDIRIPYWGRWFFWEMSGYVGISTLTLAVHGIVNGSDGVRRTWAALVILTFVLALGRYTPLFGLLWHVVPGFSLFRSPSKFLVFTAMFTALLAGVGASVLLERVGRVRPVVYSSLAASVLLGLLATLVSQAVATGTWMGYVAMIHPGWQELQGVTGSYPHRTASRAIASLLVASATCAGLAGLFALAPRHRWCRAAVLVGGVLELGLFGLATRDTLDLSSLRNGPVDDLVTKTRAADRLCDRSISNNLMFSRVRNAWGYDPASLRRYVELMAQTQDVDVNASLNEFHPGRPHRLFAMLGCSHVADSASDATTKAQAVADPLPRFSFPAGYRVVPAKADRLDLLVRQDFDPRQTVLLETEPSPRPADSPASGSVRVLEEESDALTLKVDVDHDAILLMADSYASSWTITPRAPGPQDSYAILPANHALRAIPLAAGHHVVRLQYAPISFRLGLWTTAGSIVLFLGGWWLALRDRRLPSAVAAST